MGTNKGFFLHDFFGRILPGDRNLFTPILEFLKWRRLVKNLGLLSWVALCLAVCGLLSFSFVKNMRVLHGFTEDFSKLPALTGNISDDLLIMDKFRGELLELHDANSGWWVPRFGLNKSLEVEDILRKQYVNLFEKGFLNPMDRNVGKKLELVTFDTPGSEIMVYAEHLMARIILIKAHLKGESFKSSEYVFRILPRILTLLDKKLLPEIAAKFGGIYLYFLDCDVNRIAARSKMKELQAALKQLICRKSANLYWLSDWANAELTIQDVILEDFWGPAGSKESSRKIMVDGAFTIDGHKQIGEFIKYLEGALLDVINISDKKEVFNRYYQRKYLQAWKNFAGSFSYGEHNLNGLDGWQAMASKMTTPHNPYFELIERMNKELQPFANEKNVPSWVKQVIELHKISDMASKERKAKKNPSLLTKITGKGTKLAGKVAEVVKIGPEKGADKKHIYAAAAFNAYLKNLEKLLPVSTARSQAYKAASDFFPYSLKPSESKSPFFTAYGNIRKLKSFLITPGDSSLCLKLISGPVDFLVYYASMETACSLQHSWEGIVLGEIQGVSRDKLPDLLFGKQGVVWKFVNGPAAPFLGRNQKGYFAKKAKGSRIPFKDNFFSFLTQGSEAKTLIQSEYKVQIKALPIGVNDQAEKEPYEVVLELWCAKGKTRLENYNYPTSKIFTWSPQDCSDVTLQINFEGLSLVKEYAGCNGFSLFLADFRGGSKIFKPGDFPGSEGILKKMNVSEIKVTYEFKDSAPVIKLLNKVPQKVPEIIADCWER
jgi:type VI secretion system protein ImpL